jgi:hypothetical protein
VLTVAWIGRIGHKAFHDPSVALGGAWLAALGPLFVFVGREARADAFLVLLACMPWDALLTLRSRPTAGAVAYYLVALGVVVAAQPTGVAVAVAVGLGGVAVGAESGRRWLRWVAPLAASSMALAGWLGRRPIGSWTGEGFVSAAAGELGTAAAVFGGPWPWLAALLVVGLGLAVCLPGANGRRFGKDEPVANACVLAWLIVPPALGLADPWLESLNHGPGRCVVLAVPAALLLLARGLAKLPWWWAAPVWVAAIVVAATSLPGLVFAPDRTPDWRAASAALDRLDPGRTEPVAVVVATPGRPVEAAAAHHYLEGRPLLLAPAYGPNEVREGRFWVGVPVRGGAFALDTSGLSIPLRRDAPVIDLPGLRLIEAMGNPVPVRPGAP